MRIHIVGAGLSGAVACQRLTEAGHEVVVHEKRMDVGGNCATRRILSGTDSLIQHSYGCHIFHTKNARVEEYVQRFARFTPYRHRCKTRYQGNLYTVPYSYQTAVELGGGNPSDKAFRHALDYQPQPGETAEEYCVNRFGHAATDALFGGYSRKQWGVDLADMPADAVKRLPVREHGDGYFTDPYQAIPVDGYTPWIEAMIGKANTQTFAPVNHIHVSDLVAQGRHVIWTGPLDELHGYQLGELPWRSLEWKDQLIEVQDVQGMAVVNHGDADVPYTRSYEWAHFPHSHTGATLPRQKTVVTYEYPKEWNVGDLPTHPVVTDNSKELVAAYKRLTAERWGGNVTLLGRLANHVYIDMDQAVNAALVACDHLIPTLAK